MSFPILVFLFVAVPVVEISLLINVGGAIGGAQTIFIVIFTAVLGAYLVRQQGLSTLMNLQAEMAAGKLPAMQMAEGIILLFAGAVLLTPGFITDAIGFLLLMPPVRQGIVKWVIKQGFIQAKTSPGFTGGPNQANDPNVIEGEFTDYK